MITKPNDWGEAQAIIGGARTLPAGNYKCKIVNVEKSTSKNGNDMLKIFFDIILPPRILKYKIIVAHGHAECNIFMFYTKLKNSFN